MPDRAPEPPPGSELDILLGWLAFHRNALAAKCDGPTPHDLVRTGLAGSTMSLLGLARHLTEMERVYATFSLGGEDEPPETGIIVASSATISEMGRL